MGIACCQRDQTLNSEMQNSILYGDEDFNSISSPKKMSEEITEIKYEEKKIFKGEDEEMLDLIIDKIIKKYDKTEKITFVELCKLKLNYTTFI